MQFTGYTDCVIDLKVIRMASCNQILDPWLYVIFRKNSILRIVRRIRACFRPKKIPPRAKPAPHRTHYMIGNRSFTVDASSYGRTAGGVNHRVCRHLILGGSDLIGDSERGNGFMGPRLGSSHNDLLCSQSSLSEANDCSDSTARDPLLHLRLGGSPTRPADRQGFPSFDQSSRSDVEEDEDSTHETDLFSDRVKSDLSSDLKSLEKESETAKSPVLKSKGESAPPGPKEKLRWFLPGLNSQTGEAFASYESSETPTFSGVRPPSIKSPHPIYKQKIHPSRSLLGEMTPGYSPADFRRGASGSDNQSAFVFPSPQSGYDISQNTKGTALANGSADDNQSTAIPESLYSSTRACSEFRSQKTVQWESPELLAPTSSGDKILPRSGHEEGWYSSERSKSLPGLANSVSPSGPLDTDDCDSKNNLCSSNFVAAENPSTSKYDGVAIKPQTSTCIYTTQTNTPVHLNSLLSARGRSHNLSAREHAINHSTGQVRAKFPQRTNNGAIPKTNGVKSESKIM